MTLTTIIPLVVFIAFWAFLDWRLKRDRNSPERIAEREHHARLARIDLLHKVVVMPMGVAVDRKKARDELQQLLIAEGFGVDR